MSQTLLQMTQSILSSMDSDEIDSISDTVESNQVVDIIEQTFNDIVSTIDFPDMWDFFQLELAGTTDQYTYLKLPDNLAKMEWIQYDRASTSDTDIDFYEILPMERYWFFKRMNKLDTSDSSVYNYTFRVSGKDYKVIGYNDKLPAYYTTVDNRHILFDNYQLSEGQTIQGDRTRGYGMFYPAFTRSDDFIPPLDLRQMTLLFNEAKSQCFIELKQINNAKSEQRAKRAWSYAGRKKDDTAASEIRSWTNNYGRRRLK